jgi:hypothetical protein
VRFLDMGKGFKPLGEQTLIWVVTKTHRSRIEMEYRTVKVWDLLVRMFHWASSPASSLPGDRGGMGKS